MPLTAAERQQRRRDKLAALRPPPPVIAPRSERQTRQEAWDAACETVQLLIEEYRSWRSTTPAPADAPRIIDLPRLAAQALTLGLVDFPEPFGNDWLLADAAPLSKAGTGLDAITLREQLLSGEINTDPDRFPRTAEDEIKALEWWSRIPLDSRSTWANIACSNDPVDIWHICAAIRFRD